MRRSVEVVDQIRDDQWDLPTPCTAWNLRQLLHHMITDNRGFAAAADGETEDTSSWYDETFGPDLRAEYAASADRVVAAFGADGVLEREFWLPRIHPDLRFAAPRAISFHLLDYIVHAWDVAASIGYPLVIDDDLVKVARDITAREVPDHPRRQRPEAGFRPPVPPPADATDQDLMLAELGRHGASWRSH